MQLLQVLLGHLHGGDHVGAGLSRHLEPLLVDEVGVLEAARPVADPLLAALGGAGMHGDRHAEQAAEVRASISSSNQVTRAGSSPGLK